ncbi:MAG: nucleotidyltransferase family protein [Bacteroidetes bacterium]|nr:nucleotidyltransferase family protein [Bacteroidota bacterium]
MQEEYGIIILAAGSSSRLGQPKQSLVYNEHTLLKRIVTTAIQSACGAVVVVLGANATLLKKECEGAAMVINDNWQTGMAGSIGCGLKYLTSRHPQLDGVIITVCDQPHITGALLQQLLDAHQQTHLPIIASDYGGITGTPVFFHRALFPELLLLEGDKGAKQLVQKNKDCTGLVAFPLGKEDIDTKEDYERLLRERE